MVEHLSQSACKIWGNCFQWFTNAMEDHTKQVVRPPLGEAVGKRESVPRKKRVAACLPFWAAYPRGEELTLGHFMFILPEVSLPASCQ